MALLRTLSSSVPQATVLTIVLSFLLPPASPLDNKPNVDLQTLLCLKLHLFDPSRLLASWRNDSVQYCSWAGVSCSSKSRVVALDLGSFQLSGHIPSCIANLTFLTRIHFPNNQLSGQIPFELGQLTRLQYLNLSSNDLSGVIPETLSSCSRIQIIDLGRNSLQGEIPPNLSLCLNLQQLILQENAITGGIPEGLGMLSDLSVLHLAQNSLTGSIPPLLGCSSSLRDVILSNNSLTGPIPRILANSSSLQVLELTKNHLGGEIPYTLLNSRSLKTLALGTNNFVGPILLFSQTDSPLQYLILTSNNLNGTIPSSLGNLSSLIWLLLTDNYFQGSIPASIHKIPNLQALDLTYNLLSGTIPASLYNMSALTYLGIGWNSLVGGIPYNLGYTLPSIQTLILQVNRLQGQIPASSLANATNLMVLNLEDNAFHGIVPSLGSLPNLVELNLGFNQLEAGDWSFLSSLANCTQLVKLSLSDNKIQGTLPSSIGGLANTLDILMLRANNISGTIPPEIGHLINISALYMDKNLFTGSIPDTLGNLSRLLILSLSQNKLSGKLPLSIGNLSELSELYLQENNLSGGIPGVLGHCKSLINLNLSCNSFNGSIPEDLVAISMLSQGLDLSYNQLFGQIPQEIGGLINLGTLNISNNHLSGQIPSTLGQCVHLESLNMEGNLLEGRIPESFMALRGIIGLDLSRNNLSGAIPEFFESLSSLNLLNLSFNNFEGSVPTSGIFQNGSEVFIQGNKKLCGSTPLIQLPLCQEEASRQKHTSNILKILGFTVPLSLVALSCLVIILLNKRKKAKQEAHLSFKDLKRFSYAALVKATNDFSLANLVGSGKYGLVYKGTLEFEEHAVAIKVFKLDQPPKSFLNECEVLKNTRHRNLIKVITACSSYDPAGNEFRALILEYMANGSLETWLHPQFNKYCLNGPLSLSLRILIAVDIASAMDYLHNHCVPPIVHCDLKPSNVLLDNAMGAHVGDFGLAKFLHSDTSSSINSSTSLVGPRGSIGYIAPEYGLGRKITREGDVYSYGIIILELLTGKCPTDEMFNNGLSLREFVATAFNKNISEVIDPHVIPKIEDEVADDNSEHEIENLATAGTMSCIIQLAKLGLSCAVETPKDRPTMQDVYAEITDIKEEIFALCSSEEG